MTSEGVDVDPSSEGPPGQGHTIEATLRQLNTNMGTMTQLLLKCVRAFPIGISMEDPRAEVHRAQAKNAENGAPFPPPLMSPRNIRMNPGANQGDRMTA